MAGGGGKVMWFGCLVCWLLGGFVACVALSLGRRAVDTWMDGWMDGCVHGEGAAPSPQGKPILPREGFLVSNLQHLGKTQSYVVWLLGLFVACLVRWLGRVVSSLVGRLVGTPLVDGLWRRPGQFPAVPVVPDSLCAVSRAFRRVSHKKFWR